MGAGQTPFRCDACIKKNAREGRTLFVFYKKKKEAQIFYKELLRTYRRDCSTGEEKGPASTLQTAQRIDSS